MKNIIVSRKCSGHLTTGEQGGREGAVKGLLWGLAGANALGRGGGARRGRGARRTVSEGVRQGSSVSWAGRSRTAAFKERTDVGKTAGFGLDRLLRILTVKVVRG